MAIKNWTVTVESVKNINAREIYLNDKNHPNHKKTENIISVFGNEVTSLNINYQCEKYKLKQAMKRKGGRPPTPGMEFVFTLPKQIRPSPEQWRNILKRVIHNIACSLGVPSTEFNGIVRAVVHQQAQDQERGAGDHMHVIIGKYTNNGLYLRELQKRGVIRTSKLSFNDAVKKELGISNYDYIPTKNYENSAKKRVPKWVVKQAREKEKIEEQKKQSLKLIAKITNQSEKWLLAFRYNDHKQMNRQYNRIVKEINNIDRGVIDSETKNLVESIIDTINRKSGNKIKFD
ncbi:hypothetical protein CTH30272_02847 [Allocatenococcus thiocycli]|nr:hypothetical protein CTH30272_02847 [Catenococcus thiocycli]